jgi:hypothetical protein
LDQIFEEGLNLGRGTLPRDDAATLGVPDREAFGVGFGQS